MKVAPEIDIRNGDFIRIFTCKQCYEVISETGTDYELTNDLDLTIFIDKLLFVVIPDNMTLNPQTPAESVYELLKQRDTDYHKVYKERMGIKVMTFEEEDAARHKKTPTSQDGLPEGTSIQHRKTKGL